REGVSRLIEMQAHHRADAMRLESAEGIRQLPAEQLVDKRGDRGVDGAAVAGRKIVVSAGVQIARAADQIPLIGLDLAEKIWDSLRLVLFIAIHGDEPVVAAR